MRFPGFEEEWERKELGNVCKMQAGKFVTASEINERYEAHLFPCYGGNGLRGYVSSFNYNGTYSLIGRQGALCGNVTLAQGKFHATEHAVVVKPNESLNTIWLYYLLTYLNLNQYATGMAQPGLSVQNLEKVETIIPKSEKEQEKIGLFLSLIDDRIQTQKKIIEGLQSSMQSIRKQLLSQLLRLKDEAGVDFPEWEEKKLGDIATKKSSNISANSLSEDEGDFVIYGATGILKKVTFYTEEESYVSIVKDGAGVGRLLLCEKQSSVLGTLDIIKNTESSDLKFLYHLMNTIDFSKYTSGSTIPHIYFKDYCNEDIALPCLKEQVKIANFLSLIDEKIEVEKAMLNKYEGQKKYLLQNLFI